MESRTPDYSGAFEKSLPADVLSMVAAISPGTLAHMRGVCRQWRCSISGNVQRAALQGGTEKSRRGKSGLPVAPPMPNIYHGIRVLNISCVEIDSQSLHALAGCAALSSLALQSCFLLVRSLQAQLADLLAASIRIPPGLSLASVTKDFTMLYFAPQC